MSRPRKPTLSKKEQPEYDEALIKAVHAVESAWVHDLLESGANPNCRDKDGDPILWHTAVGPEMGFSFCASQAAIIESLLAAGADPKLDNVAVRLCTLAWRGVASAAEANDAKWLLSLFGLTVEDLPRR